jgi:hypothetical protein
MSNNDVIVLNSLLEQRRTQIASTIKEDQFFEIFSFEQVLKNYDLSYEELESGKVGAGNDGGIDGIFIFVNDELINEDFNTDEIKRNPEIILYLIQAKQSETFSESAIDKIISTAIDIFDLSKKEKELLTRYNSLFVRKIELFKKIYLQLQVKHPKLYVKIVYVSKGNIEEIHPKVNAKSQNLEEIVLSRFTGAECTFEFVGARQLLDAARTEKTYTLQLRFLENYISRGEDDYIVLSKLTDYYDFVTDEKGNLRRYIFESNVRDYQGEVEVNKDIRKSLENEDTLDFWYLNNGVTILASRASIAGKIITLDDVQIVNGLQTTTTIYNYLSKNKSKWRNENRAVLIRIIVTQDPESRDRIIKATNNQIAIPTASLRALDRIQRDIEDYLLQFGWYYDRRKNYYKNLGKPLERIISIPYLAQSVMSIVLKEPDNARARPPSLIKHDNDYKRVFNENSGLDVYLVCIEIMKRIERFIKETDEKYSDFVQFRFHLGMLVSIKMLKKVYYSTNDVAALKGVNISNEVLQENFLYLIEFMSKYQENHGGTLDRIAKSRDPVDKLIESLKFDKL